MQTRFEAEDARRGGFVNIGQAADASGVSAKMIRHYEENGFIPKAKRTAAGYRVYRDEDVRALQFIRKRLALQHVADLDRKIVEMQAMRKTFMNLAHHCHGDDRPECPILDDLASTETS